VRVAIGALRKALDDPAQTRRYIATVSRRGYRFMAAVTVVDPPEPARTEESPQPAVPTPPQPPAVPPALDVLGPQGGVDTWPGVHPASLAAPRPPSHTALAGERKQVTVLFADISYSLALIRNLDPEAAQQLLDPAVHRMMDAVHRYGGTVNQVLGDGIMALFGAPMAHEDHALRACYAALAMQTTLRAYAAEVHRTHGVALHIRVGLNSGEVVVRTMHHALQMEYSAVGQTTHLAARM